MNRLLVVVAAAMPLSVVSVTGAVAQNLVISNARIIVGTGQVIEKGAVVVTDGKISAVTEGNAPKAPKGAKVINGTGMTVIAGYIDDHRHLIRGRGPEAVQKYLKEQAAKDMLTMLESGVTTVQSGGDDNAGILELKRRIESGEMKGPRILASGQVPTAKMKDEAEVRALVNKVVKDGADSIAEVHYPDVVWPYAPTEQETRNLAAGIDEAKKLGVEFQVHAVSDLSLVATVRMGAKKLVHSVNINWVTKEQAREVAAAGAQVASITGFGSPNFNVFSQDNKPKFRDGKPWPEGIVDAQGLGQEAGYMPVNLRTLYDNGVDVSYATDTTFDARAALAHELKTLSLVFSPLDLVKIMGPNSARFIDKQKELGTIETGKIADLVVLGGNPFDGFWNFLTAVVVVKGGDIVIDKRGQPDAGKPIARAM
ncbi:MAG: amidohydrolase family protein [Steroidobacteraceae bacterium]